MARGSGISPPSAVRRIWKAHGLKPHRHRQFKLSNDPNFVDKLRDAGRALCRSAGPRHRAFARREEPSPGSRSHPAGPAAEEGPARHHDARLQALAPRPCLLRSTPPRRDRHRPQHAAPPPSGGRCVARTGSRPRCRAARWSTSSSTLRRPKHPEGPRLARPVRALRREAWALYDRSRGIRRDQRVLPRPSGYGRGPRSGGTSHQTI